MQPYPAVNPFLYQFEKLAPFHTIKHFVSGRAGGVSEGEIGTLNLGLRVGDDPQNVMENRRRIAQALDIGADQLIFPAQTHSAHVRVVEATTTAAQLADTDALITHTPGLCICVMSADCVPILLYDPQKQAVGAVHAGWRGTMAHILARTVQAMHQYFGTEPADLLACIGPSICPEVYEVGPEVIEAVAQAYGSMQGLVVMQPGSDKGFLNLWEANRQQLLTLGVPATSVEIAGVCTYGHSDQFFSARKSGNRAGRFAAGIMLR